MVFQPWTLGIPRDSLTYKPSIISRFQPLVYFFSFPLEKHVFFLPSFFVLPRFGRIYPQKSWSYLCCCPAILAKVWMTEGQWLVQDHWVRISLRRQMGVGAKQQTTTQRWEMKPATIIQVRFLVFAGGRFDIIKLSMTGFNPLFCWPFHLVGFGLPNHTWHVHEFGSKGI